MDTEGDEMLTTKQAMAELQISHSTLYNWITQGRLTRVPEKPNLRRPRVLFRRSEIERIKAAERQGAE